jgi:hypothetical protein
MFQTPSEESAIRQVRERIVMGHVRDLLLGLAALGHMLVGCYPPDLRELLIEVRPFAS